MGKILKEKLSREKKKQKEAGGKKEERGEKKVNTIPWGPRYNRHREQDREANRSA